MILVSSAYDTVLLSVFIVLVSSFMYSKKNRGPIIEPCGTPYFTFSHLDELLLSVIWPKATLCCLSVR
jgi:hypothetical protein